MLTFKEFIATKREVENLGEYSDIVRGRGFLYLECLCISESDSQYWTMTDGCDEFLGDIHECEAELYAWAKREGYDA
jgi:hypothetical protein